MKQLATPFLKTLKELKEVQQTTPKSVKRCPHSKSDPDLRVLIDADFFSKVSEETLANFIILTGVDQVLFFEAPEYSKEFKQAFSGLPIPVVAYGFGCIRILKPVELFQEYMKYRDQFSRKQTNKRKIEHA